MTNKNVSSGPKADKHEEFNLDSNKWPDQMPTWKLVIIWEVILCELNMNGRGLTG